MDTIRVTGGVALSGRVEISGAKNAALPAMVASLLTAETVRLENLPYVRDILTTRKLLDAMGVEAQVRAENAAAPSPSASVDPGQMVGHNDGPVHARVQGQLTGWSPGYEFRLDNGQVWKVLKGEMKLRKPLQDPQIVVLPGFAGRWFLQVDENLPKARVYRID